MGVQRGANRQYKDSVFSLLFSNKKILIPLVNALLGTNYGPNTKIKISTIRKILSNCRMNDLSFIVDNRLIILVEHQSTINENMPYRMLQILPEHYKRTHNIKDEYRKTMSIEAAIQKAVVDCIDQNVLKPFLSKRKKEVVNMLVADFDMKIATEVAKEEALVKVAKRMVKIGKLSASEIADATGLPIDTVLKLQSDAI